MEADWASVAPKASTPEASMKAQGCKHRFEVGVDTKDNPKTQIFVSRVSLALTMVRNTFRVTMQSASTVVIEHTQPRHPRSIEPATQTAADVPRWLFPSFMAFVIVPVVAASIYLALFAADQFVSELRFVVRGNTERLQGAEALGSTGGLAYLNSNQEMYAVADYIRSPSAVEDVSRDIDLRQMFRTSAVDWFTRLRDQASGEELLRYWRGMIAVSTEPISGLVTVNVRAFARDDAARIATAILRNSEAIVDRMQKRPRGDMVARSEREVQAARDQADRARGEVARYRTSQATIDPLDTARSVIDNITDLKRQLIAADVELASAKATMGPNAPTVQSRKASREALQEQIGILERRITSTNTADRPAAQLMADYDKVEIAQTLAEQQVAVTERMLDQTRVEANRRQVYLDVIEAPTTPESALFPRRIQIALQIAFAALAAWCVVALTILSIRDHAD
jgi:capsular polysaccharide transport system permease protein